ncbi:MAG: Rpn family recombination-promoting nuclease/putative transposase, partial [Paraclostridium sp.]
MCTQLFDPKVDYIFKNIFGSEKHPKILISFLNACIKPESPITQVTIKNTELTKEYIEESFSRLDVLATTQDGEIINIEMQRADEKNMIKRSLYYWSKVFTSQYQGKGRYSKLPRTICINVLDFKLLEEEKFHNTYILKNKENNNILTNTLELHFVEIPKMKEIDQDDMLSLWTAFLDDPNNEKVVELEAKYEELHEAKIELARLSRDPKEAEKYRMREDAMNERRNFFLET